MSRQLVLLTSFLVVVGCDRVVDATIEPPANLAYHLDPSGDPEAPAGLLLQWDPVLDNDLEVYNVYSRPDASSSFDLRGSTTSTTFHDVGIPDLLYAVTAVDRGGSESGLSDEVFVDERLRLERPSFITSVSLDGAVHLTWSDNPFTSEPTGFAHYRVYSAKASGSVGVVDCFDPWELEGTTVAPAFLASALPNGQSRCFGVAAESVEGWESLWSDLRPDTPRPDARNVLMFADDVDATRAGFRFFLDANGDGVPGPLELGIVGPSSAITIDFWVFRDPTTLEFFFVPLRAGTTVAFYDGDLSDADIDPVDDLTSIDIAPETGFARSAIQAVPGIGYVFETLGIGGEVHWGAIRVTHVGPDIVIFDWSYQTAAGNPELAVRGGLPAFTGGSVVIKR